MFSYSDGNDYESILNRLLNYIDDSLDKREGSIIYDALAPAAAELSQCYLSLDIYLNQTYLLNAAGTNLDNRVADYGLVRLPATYAQVILKTYDTNLDLMDVAIGSRFAVPNEYGGYNFTVTSKTSTGVFVAECETVGTDGNVYTGDVLPLQSINNLGKAEITSIYKPGEDAEEDEVLRARAVAKINQEAFAGNVAAYKQMTIAIDGVEDCKVFPVWDGGGTVKLVLIAANHTIPTQTFVDNVQEIIDPTPQGTGVGMAPIGHTVTVAAPTQQTVTIAAEIELETGYTTSQVQASVEEQIGAYLYLVQNEFLDKDKFYVYLSKVSAAILNVQGIINVSSLTINGSAADLEIDNSDATSVKYPILGTVTLSESN